MPLETVLRPAASSTPIGKYTSEPSCNLTKRNQSFAFFEPNYLGVNRLLCRGDKALKIPWLGISFRRKGRIDLSATPVPLAVTFVIARECLCLENAVALIQNFPSGDAFVSITILTQRLWLIRFNLAT